MPSHLESANEQLHRIGMVVAQCLTTALDQGDEKKPKLEFDMERTADIQYLFDLCDNPGML